MELGTIDKPMTFKGVEIHVAAQAFVCPTCGLEAGTVETAAELRVTIADAYRAAQGLLTSGEIKALRKSRRLSQKKLAEQMNIGIAGIKRWETGTVQSASMDRALRMQLQCRNIKDSDTNVAEPLSDEEMRIIRKVAERFPAEQSVFDAAHKEKVWQERNIGALIPYSCAGELTEI
jgi:putative zinc finger/helix-turn-helix YgiT family protein